MEKRFKSVLIALFVVSLISISCSNDELEPTATCNDNIKNQGETDIDCGGECDPCQPIPLFKFEAGDYNISWVGRPYKTRLTAIADDTLTGRFCVNNTFDNCGDLGPITITRDGNKATFKFSDEICRIESTDLPGEFIGTGIIKEDNTCSFNVNGEDCVQKYTNNRVILTKI